VVRRLKHLLYKKPAGRRILCLRELGFSRPGGRVVSVSRHFRVIVET
jgi:hypothetical protein